MTTDVAQRYLSKAARAIRAAERLRDDGDAEFSVGRAYYAMFYTAKALLGEPGLRLRKHTGVHTAFGEQFAKTRRLDPKYHQWLLEAFVKRLGGDYELDALVSVDDVAVVIQQAREFLAAAQQFLNR